MGSRLDVRTPELEPYADEALAWRRVEPVARLRAGSVFVADRHRRVLRLSRVERSSPVWWEDGVARTELLAWAELEGPMLAMLRGRCGAAEGGDRWDVIAYLD